MKCEKCRVFDICKIPEEKRADCVLKTDYEYQARRNIFGMPFHQIQQLQQKEKSKSK